MGNGIVMLEKFNFFLRRNASFSGIQKTLHPRVALGQLGRRNRIEPPLPPPTPRNLSRRRRRTPPAQPRWVSDDGGGEVVPFFGRCFATKKKRRCSKGEGRYHGSSLVGALYRSVVAPRSRRPSPIPLRRAAGGEADPVALAWS
jgi:hypothetical protein